MNKRETTMKNDEHERTTNNETWWKQEANTMKNDEHEIQKQQWTNDEKERKNNETFWTSREKTMKNDAARRGNNNETWWKIEKHQWTIMKK